MAMTSSRSVVVACVIALLLQSLPAAPVQAAVGPYTLPFFDPNNWRTQGCHQGCAYDYSLNYEAVASTREGSVHSVQTGFPAGGCDPFYGDRANWVFIRHSPTAYTFYTHLSSVSVVPGQPVSAGQQIGVSGESGWSCGAHLHYSLHNSSSRTSSTSVVPDGKWTTDPGRVPWLAAYVSEHSPAGYNTLQGAVWTTWVQFRNDGGRTWSWANDQFGRGRVFLDATTSAGTKSRVSSFYVAGDWETNSRPGRADVDNVAPGQTVRFTFQLRAASAGTFTEHFNLGALSLTYFNYPYLGNFYIPITVNHCC